MPGHKDDRIWCEGCGRMQPWVHKHNPTLRAKVAKRLLRAVSKLGEAIEHWRDRDAMASYYADSDPSHPDYDPRRHAGHPKFDLDFAVRSARERSN